MKKKKLLSILLTLAMLASLVPFAAVPAMAAPGDESTGISYREYSYSGGTLSYADMSLSENYTVVEDTTPVAWSEGWYVVEGDVTISNRITVSGNVKLILCDGAKLTASKGITVTGNNRLTIYGQKNGTGALIAGPSTTVTDSGIGGITTTGSKVGGHVTVHGGSVKAYAGGITGIDQDTPTTTDQGSWGAAGIGGGGGQNTGEAPGGTFTMYGGSVLAYGNQGGAGIGGGNSQNGGAGGFVNVYGGTLEAHGVGGGAGIGGGNNGSSTGASVLIAGGTVKAYGGSNSGNYGPTAGAGIGGGNGGAGGSVTISGGTVTATGGAASYNNNHAAGAGIGGGRNGAGGTVNITGGTVTATGGTSSTTTAMGIGRGSGNGSNSTLSGANLVIYGGASEAEAVEQDDYASTRWTYMRAHFHSFTYSLSGATITATCQNDGCGLPESKATLTIKAPVATTVGDLSANYDAFLEVEPAGKFPDAPDATEIKYYESGSATSLDYTPTSVGDYTAKIKAHELTASVDYKIYAGKKDSPTGATFEATGYDTGVLSNVDATMAYFINGDAENAWDITGTTVNVSGLRPGDDIDVVVKGDGSDWADSDPYEIQVDASRATTPTGIGAVDCQTEESADGKLTGITADMEYQKSGEESWTEGTGSAITVGVGTYLVRTKAHDHVLASENAELVVSAANVSAAYYKVVNGALVAQDPVSAAIVTDSTTALGTAGSESWYVVNKDVTNANRIVVHGDVHLILADGKALTADAGITVADGDTLTIYGQEAGSGELHATGADGDAGIGGTRGSAGGAVTVHGGQVYATGSVHNSTGGGNTYRFGGAGIGGGAANNNNSNAGAGGIFTIYAGSVTAVGGGDSSNQRSYGGAGIGGGGGGNTHGGAGGSVYIYGGNVKATGGVNSNSGSNRYPGAGIGGGGYGAGGSVYIYGGSVEAAGGRASDNYGQGIGRGRGSSSNGSIAKGDNITVYGSDTNSNPTSKIDNPNTTRNRYMKTESAQPAPEVSFVATGTDAGTLSDVDAGMSYRVGDAGDFTPITGTDPIDLTGLSDGDTIYVKQTAVAPVYTVDSDTYVITLDAEAEPTVAGEACSAPNTDDGKITGLNDTKAYQYYKVGGDTAEYTTVENVSEIGSLAAGTYVIRAKAHGWTLASPDATVIVKGKLATPEATFVATGLDAGTLSDVDENMAYYINDDTTVWAITDTEIALTGLVSGNTINVYNVGGDANADSDVQVITVAQHDAPDAADITVIHCTDADTDDGKISVTGDKNYEYRIDGDTTYYDLPAEGLASGTYKVRAAAGGVYLASADTDVVIKQKLPTPTANEVTFGATGTDAGELTGKTGMAYYLGSDTDNVWVINDDNAFTVSGLADGSTINVYKVSSDVSKVDSDPYVINITRPAKPTLGGGYATGDDANGTITITNLDTTAGVVYQIKKVGDVEFADATVSEGGVITLLEAGTYEVRIKAADTMLQSENASAIVFKKLPTPTATFTATGESTGTLTTGQGFQGLKYSIDGAAAVDMTDDPGGCYADLTGLTGSETIAVFQPGDGTTTSDSDAAEVTVGKMDTPNLTPTQPKSGEATGIIPTVAGVHEISDDDGASWADAGNDEAVIPGTYKVRAKFSTYKLTSDAQVIKIDTAYYVTVDAGTGSDYYIAGDVVAISATVPGGKLFDKWTSDYALDFDATAASTSFHMPAQDVTVTATFKDAPAPAPVVTGGSTTTTYKINVAAATNGTATASKSTAAANDKITVTAKPADGYELDAITVKGDKTGGSVTVTDGAFTMPAEDVIVTVTFKEKAKETPTEGITVEELLTMFDDLDPNGWYLDDVAYCVENGIMKGMGERKFGPDVEVNRAMVAQLLWNLAGNPAGAAAAPFDDVAADAWYADAVAWAYANGVTKGTSNGFEPDAKITREQLAVMLYNFAKLQGEGFTGLWSFKLDFPDAGEVSDWAVEAISWMVMNGIINGTVDEAGNTVLDPQGDATRVQLAAMVHRFCEFMKK